MHMIYKTTSFRARSQQVTAMIHERVTVKAVEAMEAGMLERNEPQRPPRRSKITSNWFPFL